MGARTLSAVMVAWLAMAGCSEDPSRPYLAFAGGGFVFNYRLAEASYGIVLKPLRPLPEGSVVEVSFEDPAGGPPIARSRPGRTDGGRLVFETPPVHEVAAGRRYRVTIVLRDATGGVLQRLERTVTSTLDQSVLPPRPLVIGPGYTASPDGR